MLQEVVKEEGQVVLFDEIHTMVGAGAAEGAMDLDASLLMIPLVGFLPPSDERVTATVELIQKELVADGFVLRYHPDGAAHVDGLPPGEGAFLPCSFWLVDCLCLMEGQAEARAFFQRLLAVCSRLAYFLMNTTQRNRRQVVTFLKPFLTSDSLTPLEVFQKVTEPPITEAGNERIPESVGRRATDA